MRSVRGAAIGGERERLPFGGDVGPQLGDEHAARARRAPPRRRAEAASPTHRLAVLAGVADAARQKLSRVGRVAPPAQRLQDHTARAARASALRRGDGAPAGRPQRLEAFARRLPALRVARPRPLPQQLARPQPGAAAAARDQEHGEPRPHRAPAR